MNRSRRVIFYLVLALVAVVVFAGPAMAADGLGEFAGGDSNDVWTAILGFVGVMIVILYVWYFFYRE